MYERQGDDVQCEACWRKWAETAVCEHCKAIVVDLRFHDVQVGNYVEPHYECGIGGPEWDPGYRTPECWQRQVDALQAIVDRLLKVIPDALVAMDHVGLIDSDVRVQAGKLREAAEAAKENPDA